MQIESIETTSSSSVFIQFIVYAMLIKKQGHWRGEFMMIQIRPYAYKNSNARVQIQFDQLNCFCTAISTNITNNTIVNQIYDL